MKKFMTLLLSAVMVLSLAACGAKTEAPASSAPSAPAAPAGPTPAETKVEWPTDPVTLIVSAKAGGGTDLTARNMLEKLADYGTFVVENSTDGAGVIGWEQVKAADPESCTELVFYNTGLFTSYATGLTDVDPINDLVPVCTMPTVVSQYLVVPKNSPFNTLQDLVDYATEHPGELKCGAELGALSHIYLGIAEKTLGISWSYTSTGSDADRVTLIMGNNIDVTCCNASTTKTYFESGDVKVLAALHSRTSATAESMKDIPTLSECGYEDLTTNTQLIVWAPAGADQAMYEAIFEAMHAAITDPAVKEAIAERGGGYDCCDSFQESYDLAKKTCDEIVQTCKDLGLA